MGGFGIYVAGHSEDLIIDTVKAQLSRQGLHSQELIDPLRGYLAKAMADCTPGDLQQCFFTNCGTEAVEIAMKLARFKSKGKWFISTTHAFHGKTGGSLSLTAKGIYRQPYLPLIQQVQHVEYGNAAASALPLRICGRSGNPSPPWSWSRSRVKPALSFLPKAI